MIEWFRGYIVGFNLDDYETVKDRIARFYADHPDANILTELASDPATIGASALFKASIMLDGVIRATGYAYEAQGQGVNRDAWVENAETSAIGRVLANFNYCGTQRPSREEMSKTEVARDVHAMSDPRDSRGAYSPPVEPGAPATRGDGIATRLRAGQVEFNGLMAAKDDSGGGVFSPAEIKDMQADLCPGGRTLVASADDLAYLRNVFEKWMRRKNDYILERAGLDKAVEGLDFGAIK